MTIVPLGAQTTANGDSNKTNLDNASHVFVSCSTASTITIKDSSGTITASFYLPANDSVSFRKDRTDEVYAASADVYFTKVGFAN